MTKTAELEKHAWKSYFDAVSKGLTGKQVEIEIASLDIGSQIAAEWLPVDALLTPVNRRSRLGVPATATACRSNH